jgi:hypothetical protein
VIRDGSSAGGWAAVSCCSSVSAVVGLELGYLSESVNVCHAWVLKVSIGPLRSAVSRTVTSVAVATSTQFPPLPSE